MQNHPASSQTTTDTTCRDLCAACAQACRHALFRHCLQVGGEHATADHVRLMMDCADICQTSASFMDRESPLHARICAACAEVCQACADDCRSLDGMEACVAACERCAASCSDMARSAA